MFLFQKHIQVQIYELEEHKIETWRGKGYCGGPTEQQLLWIGGSPVGGESCCSHDLPSSSITCCRFSFPLPSSRWRCIWLTDILCPMQKFICRTLSSHWSAFHPVPGKRFCQGLLATFPFCLFSHLAHT